MSNLKLNTHALDPLTLTAPPPRFNRQRRPFDFQGSVHENFEWYFAFLAALDHNAEVIGKLGSWSTSVPVDGFYLVEGTYPLDDDSEEGGHTEETVGVAYYCDRYKEWCDPADNVIENIKRWMPLPSLETMQPALTVWDAYVKWVEEVCGIATVRLYGASNEESWRVTAGLTRDDATGWLQLLFRSLHEGGVSTQAASIVWADLYLRQQREGVLPQIGTLFDVTTAA